MVGDFIFFNNFHYFLAEAELIQHFKIISNVTGSSEYLAEPNHILLIYALHAYFYELRVKAFTNCVT